MGLTKSEIKKATTAINRKLKENYKELEIETFEWYIDLETSNSYSWKFLYPALQEIWLYTYCHTSQKVNIRKVESK